MAENVERSNMAASISHGFAGWQLLPPATLAALRAVSEAAGPTGAASRPYRLVYRLHAHEVTTLAVIHGNGAPDDRRPS